jgi:transposase-like protein
MASNGANEEIRQRERVISFFPNRESASPMLGALLMEIDEEWTTGRKYINMDEYEAWKKAQQARRESAQACAATALMLTAPFAEEGNFTHNLGLGQQNS